MIKIALLLIGGKAFRKKWWAPALLGLLLVLAAIAVVADPSGLVAEAATVVLGAALVLFGLVKLFSTPWRGRGLSGVVNTAKALAFLLFGVMVANAAGDDHRLVSWLFALGFAMDGLSRLPLIAIVRFRRWHAAAAFSAMELVLAGLIVTDWPLPSRLDIPLCISVLLALSGMTIIRFALLLRSEEEEVAISAFSLFGERSWNEHAPVLIDDDEPEAPPAAPLRVLVWTPWGAANRELRRPIIDRYLMVHEDDGSLSMGHSALECAPDLYLSHWPAQEFDGGALRLMRDLSADTDNDVPGFFPPSYEFECSDWMPADEQILFTRYSERRLRAYCAGYFQTTAYNITNRNCSIAVAYALDATLEGSLDSRLPWLNLLRLMLTPSLWQAAYIRSRAEHMCWTPGLVLDYARALQQVVEPSRHGVWHGLGARLQQIFGKQQGMTAR